MEEKVNLYTHSSFLASLVQDKFRKKIGRNSSGYFLNSLNERDLSSFLDNIESDLENISYKVLYIGENNFRNLDSPVVRERFSDGLIFENKLDSKTYTKNGRPFKLVG